MAFRPWKWSDNEELGSHLSYVTNQMIGELIAGAHLSAMNASNLFEEGRPIRMEVNRWFNALKRIYVATIPLLRNYKEEMKIYEKTEKRFLRYFDQLSTRPDNRTVRMHYRKIEEMCMNYLNEMQLILTETLQKYYFFFRFKDDDHAIRGLDSLPTKENVTRWAKELGYELKKTG